MRMKPIALCLAALALAVPASAQEHFGLSRTALGVTVGARIGPASVRVGLGRGGYVSSRRCAPVRVWVPGCYETAVERVWVPACRERRWIEPVLETRYDACGNAYRVVVCSGRWEWVDVPGRYDSRTVRRWVPGHYEHR